MNKKFSLAQFLRRYPNDEACLDEIYRARYPKGVNCSGCNRLTKYYKLKGRNTYSCGFCATQLSPLTGTIFEKSSVSLRLWFYAIFLMVNTRSGISAKQLERELGVSYKTAHRMFKMIRLLMTQEQLPLVGEVEADETYLGGKAGNRKDWSREKEIIMGMVERGGKVKLVHIPDTYNLTMIQEIRKHVSKDALVITDQHNGYKRLPEYGYRHQSVNHGEHFRVGNVHTQNIESIWNGLKRSIYGVHRSVSKQYLQQYANEHAWRFNHRHLGSGMYDALFNQIVVVKPA